MHTGVKSRKIGSVKIKIFQKFCQLKTIFCCCKFELICTLKEKFSDRGKCGHHFMVYSHFHGDKMRFSN